MRQALIALTLLAAAGPALAQDARRWNFSEDEEGLSLGYAIPESDDAGPFFYCRRGEGKVGVIFFVEHRIAVGEPTPAGEWLDAAGKPAPWPAEMTVASGKQTVTVPGGAVNDEMNGGSMVEVKLDPNAPVLSAFAQTGEVTLSAFGETSDMPAAPAGQVRTLLEGCRG